MFNHVLCNHICPYLQTQSQKKNPISSRKSRPQDAEHGSHDRTQVVDCSWWTHLHWDAFEAFSDRMSQLMKPVGFPTPKLWDHGSLGSTLVHEVLFEKHIVVARWNMQLFCRDLEGGCRYEKLLLGVCTMTFDEKSYDFNVSRYWTVFSSLIATTKTTQNSEPLVFFLWRIIESTIMILLYHRKNMFFCQLVKNMSICLAGVFPTVFFPQWPNEERPISSISSRWILKSTAHIWVFPKIGGKPPKWMVYFMENPINKWMIWGENLFLETPISAHLFLTDSKKNMLCLQDLQEMFT